MQSYSALCSATPFAPSPSTRVGGRPMWSARRGRSATTRRRAYARHRGVRNVADLQTLTIRQVLKWADEYHVRTGRWPTDQCRPQQIPGSDGETWYRLIMAMRVGNRGFRKGSSLAALLAEHRGVRNLQALPHLHVKQILAWADAFHERTGDWPSGGCSPQEIPDTDGER